MVDRIAIQRTALGRGIPFLASPERVPEEKITKPAYKSTELVLENKHTKGRIHFTDEVVEALAFVSAAEVPGLAVQISDNDITQERMIKKSRLRGIRARFSEDRVIIDLSIAVRPERSAVEIAKDIQERVCKNVENMTGLIVAAVNVHVASILSPETMVLH